jgi:hypothetical protein
MDGEENGVTVKAIEPVAWNRIPFFFEKTRHRQRVGAAYVHE